jgi:hypothetical protein
MRFHLIVWLESQEQWHDVDEIDVPQKPRHGSRLSYATAVAHNTHPRLRGIWAVVQEDELAEAMARDPRTAPTLRDDYSCYPHLAALAAC